MIATDIRIYLPLTFHAERNASPILQKQFSEFIVKKKIELYKFEITKYLQNLTLELRVQVNFKNCWRTKFEIYLETRILTYVATINSELLEFNRLWIIPSSS